MGQLNSRLFNYQVEGATWLAANRTAILADEMGIGKSAQALAAADLLGLQSLLIVCPGIARDNWLNEIREWSTTRRSAQAVMSSSDLITRPVVVVSYSLLRSLKVLKALVSRRWDAVILDEAQLGKSDEAWRSKAIYGVNFDARHGLSSVASRVWLLSGTIMPNNPSELWTHCHALFPDVAQGMSFERWRDEYCQMIPGTTRVVRSRNEAKLVKLLRPHVMRRTAMGVGLQLPPLRFSHVPVHPATLPPMPDDVAETAAVVRAALATVETPEAARKGKILLDGLDDVHLASLRKWTGIAKAPAIAEYLRMDIAAGMGKFVVFAWHREVISIIHDGLPGTAVIHGDVPQKKRQAILDEFQRPGGKTHGLIVQGDIASTAIPLTAATNAIFAEPPWVPAQVQQAVKRLHRQGQTKPVFGRMFSLGGSFDEVVIGVLTRKVIETMRLNRSLETQTQGQ